MPELDELVSRINPLQLRRYLVSSGWSRPSSRAAVENVFTHDGFQIVVPNTIQDSDAHKRLRDALRTLAGFEERTLGEIASDVQVAGYDVITSSVPTEFIRDESISLSVALAFTQEMKALLAITASTEMKPLPFFGRVRKAGLEYSDHCRFGHTYRGSFGFLVESPLPPPNGELLEGLQVVPFERKVLRRFISGIRAVTNAARSQTVAPITESVREGFNANSCELISNLISRVSPGGIDIAVLLNKEVPEDDGLMRPMFSLNMQHAEIASEAARVLRRNEIDIPVAVFGLTTRLQNQTDPSDIASSTGEHEVIIQWASEDYGDIQVTVNLSPEDYLRAVSAHANGKPVAISGNLKKIGRRWILALPRNLIVADQIHLFN